MKIVYVNSYYAPDEVGGAEKSVQFLAEAMVKHGHQVEVICTGRTPGTDVVNNVTVHRLAVDNIYYPLDAKQQGSVSKAVWHSLDIYRPRTKNQAKILLARFRPDVIHTNTMTGLSPSVLDAAKELGIPVVHTLRDYYLLCPSAGMFKGGQTCASQCSVCRLFSAPKKKMIEAVSVVVGNSRFILDKHLSHGLFPQSRSQVIYNAYEPKSGRRERSAAVSEVTFGFIGRLSDTKGLEILLRAFAQLTKSSSRLVRLLIAGDGDPTYVADLKQLAGDSPVTFLGRVPQADFYPRIDWCVLPSLWDEPLARVIFESFAHGVPLIASKTGGTTELVDSEQSGFVYEAHDESALVSAMQRAVDQDVDTWQVMSDNVWERGKRFRPASVFQNYMGVYEDASARARHETSGA